MNMGWLLCVITACKWLCMSLMWCLRAVHTLLGVEWEALGLGYSKINVVVDR